MDESFKVFINTKNNNVETLMKWLKDVGVTSDADEGTTRKYFADNAPDPHNVTMSQFRSVIFLIAQSQNINEQIIEDRLKSKIPDNLQQSNKQKLAIAECYFHNLCKTGKTIDTMYEKLSKEGKDNVNAVVKFLHDTTIMDALHAKEENVREFLANVKDGRVDRTIFKNLMFHLGQCSGTNISLSSRRPSVHNELNATTSATRMSEIEVETERCYFTTLCKTATVIDNKLDKLVKDGRSSICEIINFLQDTTIMDALEDKKKELFGLPSSSKKRESGVVISLPPVGSSSRLNLEKDTKGPAPVVLPPRVTSTTAIPTSAKAVKDAGKKEGSQETKGGTRTTTSGTQLSGQRSNRQISGQRQSGQRLSTARPSQQKLTGRRGEPPRRR